ncbi:efflux RND transporter periplasmic adaptor subunit [Rhizobium wuzhouense]|uniref:Efflux transporter periplasmic adaptor subunit n=1 Tax=Rhizobium wuzhouense TaxID=1986026 RepID=A0ABX5NW57_9HYPH|nr:efflux RND transporter periplasmic adaptor subunit [Rhizobium wuzhouense]PYB77415.1 efflux transporter periplasmic adaptor subunit [Rhizobium wuzhouense]
MRRRFRFWSVGILCLPLALLSACSDRSDAGANAQADTEPARVSVITVHPEAVTVYDELPGRVSALRTAEIRSQVNGIIQQKLFVEGAFVQAGTPLFQIDTAPFSADADAAAAVLARTEAEALNANLKFERARVLSAQKVTSDEAFNNATAALAQAKASVAEAKANLARRKLELSYATIRSPISGIIGQSFMSEGGLASSSATSPLAVVQQIDEVYLDVRQSAMTLERLRETASGVGISDPDVLPVIIRTITGKPHGHPGKVVFSDISVDAATGSLGIRILVPNPEGQLLPGMFIRAQVPREVYSAALLVPQEAVTRDLAGQPQLILVGADKSGVKRTVVLGSLVNGRYIVESGLSAGETVVVLGQDRVQEGQPLEPSPSQSTPEEHS